VTLVFNGWDGVTYPDHSISISTGGNISHSATTLVLGHGPTLGTATLGGGGWNEITDDVRLISRSFGRNAEGESAQVGTCSFTVDNESGAYDPANPSGGFWGANLLNSQQYSLELNNTSGWVAGTSTTIASSTTVGGYHGVRALQLTRTGTTGNATAKTSTGTGGVLLPPLTACRATAWFKAGTTGRLCKVRVLFYDENGNALTGTLAGSQITDTTTGWTQATVAGLSPALTAYAAVEVEAASALAAEVHYADAIMLQPSGIEVGMPIRWSAIFNGVTYPRFYGTVSDIRIDLGLEPEVVFDCSDGLETLGRAQLDKTTPQFDLDTTGERIGHLADVALWPTSLRALDTGFTFLGPTELGDSALNLMKLTEMTEYGLLFVDGGGQLTLFDRHQTTQATRSTTVQADLTNVELETLESSRNKDQAFNVVHITRDAFGEDDVPVEQTALDAVSQSRYGVIEFNGDVGRLLKQDEDALVMAQGLLHRGKQPKTRISEIRIEAMTLDLWATLLALILLDRIKVRTNMEYLIQGMSETVSMDPPRWDMNFNTSSPYSAPSQFKLGTSQLGSGKLGW
jgi:hypothetical protein